MSLRTRMGVFGAALAVVLGFFGPAASAAPISPLPADPAAHGYIGLCNEAGQNITGGSVTDVPFVWKTISTMRPPKNYSGVGENAVLDVYQPRPDAAPAYWSGRSMTATSFYKNAAFPTNQATYADLSLGQFVSAFPPKIDGLYVLRMQFGKLNYGVYSSTYPTTTIQVTGRTWHVVQGGTVDCASGSAVSDEQVTGVISKSQALPHKPSVKDVVVTSSRPHVIASGPASRPMANSSSGATSGGSGVSASSGSPATGHDASAVADSQSSAGTGPSWVLWLLLGLVVALASALALSFRIRRGGSPTSGPS